jgi:cytochrome c peroxidase
MKTKSLFFTLAAGIAAASCSIEQTPDKVEILDLPQTPYNYGSGDNELATLGRVLFYDRNLSVNNSLACASCHKQSLAFADNVAFSVGFENRVTRRNSMPIQNLKNFSFEGDMSFPVATPLFWDGREHSLNTMVLKPITNHVEMGVGNLDNLNDKLSKLPYYSKLFREAYGVSEVTSEKISKALVAFLGNISSNQSRFDRHLNGGNELTALELKGRDLFLETYDCNQCHRVENAHGYLEAGTFANIGLDAQYTDQGVAEVSNNEADNGRFKIPSLRNVALTAPYMHDGRFETLDEVIDHYSGEIEDNPNLDLRLSDSNGQPLRLNISQSDRKAIIAFLNTLTDPTMTTDVRFSNPFKAK